MMDQVVHLEVNKVNKDTDINQYNQCTLLYIVFIKPNLDIILTLCHFHTWTVMLSSSGPSVYTLMFFDVINLAPPSSKTLELGGSLMILFKVLRTIERALLKK